MRRARRWSRRAGVAAAATLLVSTPIVAADETAPGTAVPELKALASAAAWHDVLEAYRTPELPPPSDSESVIVIFDEPAAGRAAPGARSARASEISQEQQQLEQSIVGIGGVVNFRYRMLINGLGVRVPTGRIATLAQLPAVKAVVPVSYLAPAAEPTEVTPSSPVVAAAQPAALGPAHVALIDGGIDPTHPWLGGGVGPTYPIIGGADLVERDGSPILATENAEFEPHGTQMASIILRSKALADLPPEQRPRLLAYRVVAAEQVDGRIRPLARTDRVLAAMERAMDPDGNGSVQDAPQVLVLGLARGFDGGGYDPVSAAIDAADRLGTVVVAPAGNDGPTFSRSGSIGGPAAARGALVVGGVSAGRSARTAHLQVQIGGAQARTDPLPLIGGTLPRTPLAVRMVEADGLLVQGDSGDEYTDEQGQSLVSGRLAVVLRGGGSLREKARSAATAGAAALAIWDQQGSGVFPGLAEGADWPLPIVGMGPRQGAALRELLAGPESIRVNFLERPQADVPRDVASFSSRGPTGDGRGAPHLVAPAVGVEAAFPGQDAPRVARLTGTSASAAEAAARALRIRIDRPELRPADVKSLMVANARRLPGGGTRDQGAGVLSEAAAGRVVISPAIITTTIDPSGRVIADIRMRSLSGAARYSLSLQTPGGESVKVGPARRIGPGFATARLRLGVRAEAGDDLGELVVRDGNERIVGRAPVVFEKPVQVGKNFVRAPVVRVKGGVGQVALKIGGQAVGDNRLRAVRLNAVKMWLVPAGGGTPLLVSGEKEPADWPAGDYRFLLSRRLADGTPLPSGKFRLRVTARGPDGSSLSASSKAFSLGS